ncbi:hypothetical protein O181_033680 [Austropuccinia psidii MF-1]|uniref:Uncharacterized protein n=1 Tax=Austropuccinia psidii MF-1 TaxID=1389203 RepID=A0A9Q3D1N5_9BASI|nr:hypothetical protein [Austropuccinia psidii MF-1]
MFQKIQEISRGLCAYCIEYKNNERYTHEWVNPQSEIQLPYSTSQHATPGKKPSLVDKGWSPLLPVDHLKKNLSTINPTAKYFHDMWKREYETAFKCRAEGK